MQDIAATLNHWLEHRALAEYIDKGYQIIRYPDHTIELCYKGASIAAWPEHAVKAQMIYDMAKSHEAKLAGVRL